MKRFHIKFPRHFTPEVNAVIEFFVWQEFAIKCERDDSMFAITKGYQIPVLFENDAPVAQGYFEIIDF